MEIKFNSDILTANTSKREITGIIVPFGKPGFTNMGEVVFEQGSLQLNNDIKLFEDHDMNKVRGRMISHEVTPMGIVAKFKVARTTAGDDVLALAQDGLKSGLSIGASIDQYENKENQVYVTKASIVEVSVVDTPAFADAQITDVAAQKADETEVTANSASDEQTNQTESEVTSMANPEEVTPVVETAPEVAVEASKVTAPVAYAKPRVNTDVTAGQYAMAQIKAQRGDSDARDLVAALDVATVSENAGVVPPQYLREIIGVVDNSRPFIDSIERAALPNSGMTMYIPRITAQASVEQTAEGVEVGSTDSTIDNLSVSIVKFAGANVVNLELIERSDPSYVDQLIRMLAASYAQKTDAYAAKAAVNACGSTSGSTIYKSIAQGIADSYGVMRFTPNKLMVSPTGGNDSIDFANLLGAVDGSNRPLFAAAASQNAAGLITQGSTNGSVAGLDLVVDPNYTGDNSNVKYAMVYPSAAATFYESPTLQLRTNVVANGQVEIGLYGFVAFANKYPTAFRGLSVA
jgi:HK97 family phage prohead protease